MENVCRMLRLALKLRPLDSRIHWRFEIVTALQNFSCAEGEDEKRPPQPQIAQVDAQRRKWGTASGTPSATSFSWRRPRTARVLRSGHRLDATAEPRELPRGRVAVQDALRHAAMEFGLSRLQGGLRRLLVTVGNGQLDLLDEGADAAAAGAVELATFGVATDPLFGGLVVGHN